MGYYVTILPAVGVGQFVADSKPVGTPTLSRIVAAVGRRYRPVNHDDGVSGVAVVVGRLPHLPGDSARLCHLVRSASCDARFTSTNASGTISKPAPSETVMTVGDVLTAIAYAGVGAGAGSIGAAVVTSRSGKAEARAHAADLIANAAGALADRLERMNTTLEAENRQLRHAVGCLTDAIDEMIPMLVGPPEVINRIRKATSAAKQAI